MRERNFRRGSETLELRLSVMKSPIHGFGCFATARFPKNSAIAEYAGERIARTEADLYIDGSVDGNDSQHINHSCEPNADVFIIDGFMIVFALREIVPGEEITVDYLNSFEEDRTVCQCGAASCRQRISKAA
jgi:SET domain-containing protein